MAVRDGNSLRRPPLPPAGVPRVRPDALARRVLLLGAFLVAAPAAGADSLAGGEEFRLDTSGDGIPRRLPGTAAGNAERGRALLVERGAANCLLCHAFPDPALRIAGNVGPSLADVGRKFSAAQLRLRIADIQKITPNAVMPSYYRVEHLDRVGGEHRGKPILDAQQIEDLVAYLETLK